ncbi:MAG: hypothetical protein ACKV2T_26095 [Kofleriaceae bacterium]
MRCLPLSIVLVSSVAFAQGSEPSEPAVAEPSAREQCLARRKELAAQAQANPDLNERARLLRELPVCSGATPPPPPTTSSSATGVVAPPPPDTIATGFVVEARIDTAYAVIDGTFAPGSVPGIFLGGRTPVVSVGVGLELVRVASSTSSNGLDAHASQTGFLLLPGVRVRMVRTAEGDTELLGVIDAGIGTSWISDSDPDDDPASPVRLRFQLGLSPRHWFTRSFALGASIGLRYEIGLVSTEINGMTVDSSISATSMFSSLQAIAVF